MSDQLREAVLKGLHSPLNLGYNQMLSESITQFTEEEENVVQSLRESATFQAYPKGSLDRHEIKFLLTRIVPAPVTVCEKVATKLAHCLNEGLLDENLDWNEERKNELSEGMGSSTTDAHSGMSDHGMYGVDAGGDRAEPKGGADSGSKQKADRGDHSHTADKGDAYMQEGDKKDMSYEEAQAALEARYQEEREKLEAEYNETNDKEDPEKNFPPGAAKDVKGEAVASDQAPKANMAKPSTTDANTAATDGALKHGKKQMEGEEETEESEEKAENAHSYSSGHSTEDPKQGHTGEGSAGSKSKKGTEDGETPSGHPDYAKAKEQDPAHDPKNKGPAQARNESVGFDALEEEICESLSDKGYRRGTPQWERAFKRAFDNFLTERARSLNEAD